MGDGAEGASLTLWEERLKQPGLTRWCKVFGVWTRCEDAWRLAAAGYQVRIDDVPYRWEF